MKIRVKQLGERTATAGLHMGGGLKRRKLEPGEVIDIPDDFKNPEDARPLVDILLDTGMVEITRDQATRPLEYSNSRDAKLCSPTFRPRGPDEERERDAALARSQKALAEQKTVKVHARQAGKTAKTARKPSRKAVSTARKPSHETPDTAAEIPGVPPATSKPPPDKLNPRAARRAARSKVLTDEQKVPA